MHTAKHYQKVSLLKAYGLPKAIKDIFKHELFSVTGLGKFNLIPLNGKANPLQQICDNSQGLVNFVWKLLIQLNVTLIMHYWTS